MDRLNLPIIKRPFLESKSLLMDEYLQFVNFNLKYTVNIKASRDWKRMLSVNMRFSLK